MTWWTRVIPLLLLILPNVASTQEQGCSTSPISIDDISAAAQCSKMVYDYPNKKAEGKTVGDSKFKVVKEFNYDVDKEDKEDKEEPKRRDWTGHLLKAVIAQAKEDDDSTTTMFCFMGTNSVTQLLEQLTNGAMVCIDSRKGEELKTEEKKCSEQDNGVEVFDYDWNTFKRFREFIEKEFVPMIVEGQKYILTGHSLGGALSSVLAMMTIAVYNKALWKNSKSSLITFGQPRVGDEKFADLIDTIPLHQKMRFIYSKDPVPHVPDSGYRHHSREIYITHELTQNYEDDWIVCPKGDSEPYHCGLKWPTALTAAFGTGDHAMANYLQSVETMASSPDKLKQFMEDVCMGEDNKKLKDLKQQHVDDAKPKEEDDDDDDWEPWDQIGKKKAKKVKGKSKRT